MEDSETWAAHLEEILNKRVLNAGVGAYGIDQAFLRAELLLDKYDPDVVILSFISDDINRTEYSYYPYGGGWKPYFEYGDGSLILRNVPVPQQPAPRGSHSFQTLRRALGYSFLANAVLDRIAPQWWHNFHDIERIHNDGENVSVDLLVRFGRSHKRPGRPIHRCRFGDKWPHRRQRPASEPCQTCERERRHGFGPFNGNAEASAQPVAESVPARWPLLPNNEPLGRRAHRGILARKRDSIFRTVSNRSVKSIGT